MKYVKRIIKTFIYIIIAIVGSIFTAIKMFVITSIATIVLFFAAILVFVALFGEPYTTPDEIKDEFYNNNEMIVKITEYLENTPYTNISIYNVDYMFDLGYYGYWYVHNQYGENNNKNEEGYIPINDDNFVNDISYIFNKRKYHLIRKDGNLIYFQMWANLDIGRGIVYSIDGSELDLSIPSEIQFLTTLEKIEGDWYYYEDNFNEWKLRNGDTG